MTLKQKLARELALWEAKDYEYLKSMTYPHVYTRGSRGDHEYCQVELVLLEDTPAYVSVSIGVSDEHWLSNFLPKPTNLLAYSAGSGGSNS
jgi:hypothetical protein